VTTLAVETCALHPRLNADLPITAAIAHDLGLTRAFTYTAEIIDSDAGRMLGHLELGLELLRDHAARVPLPQRAWHPLAHCVLTHHGAQARVRAHLRLRRGARAAAAGRARRGDQAGARAMA
jgi:3'-5' exoribonuclease